MKKIKVISTLGPSSLNKNFLKETKKIVDIYRLNLSHLTPHDLIKNLKFLKKNKIKNICIDTEGAQIRTYKCKTRFLHKGNVVDLYSGNISSKKNIIQLYPNFNILKIKKETKIHIGFDDLVLKVNKNYKKFLRCKVISSGKLEQNKGVHIENNINLNFLTDKDLKSIDIAKKFDVQIFALSFTNYPKDVIKFKKLIGTKKFLISKIETKNAVKNFRKISLLSNATLIDRGDLSRYVDIVKIPKVQKEILTVSQKLKKPVYIATNLLETMTSKPSPTRAEANDIYYSLKSGAKGLVLAAETAIGKYPIECVKFIKKFINDNKV
jgi:pyruvate kinase